MKKYIYPFLILLIVLSLAGCSKDVSSISPGSVHSGTTADHSTEAGSEDPIPEVNPFPTVAEYSCGCTNMRLELPEGWSYDIKQQDTDPNASFGINFWPDADPSFVAQLHFNPEFYGICGTGVTFENLELKNGLRATLAWETFQSDDMWAMVFFEDLPGQYTLELRTTTQLWDKYRQELLSILDNAELAAGILTRTQALSIGAEYMVDVDQGEIFATFNYLDGTWSIEGGDYLLLLSAEGELVEIHKGN